MYIKIRPAPSAAVSAFEPDDEGRTSFRHNFGKTARKNPGSGLLFISQFPHATLTAMRAANGVGCGLSMDLLPRHFSLFQFRVGSWFIASSVLVAALTGECWRLNGSQDYKRQSQSER